MRVISMVPSWTETLLSSGVQVVGRTRFCIHPEASVTSVPVVGGTKDWDLQKITALNADLLLLDQEENPKWMAEQSPLPWVATHIQKIEDVPRDLRKINLKLMAADLDLLCRRWDWVIAKPQLNVLDLQNLPGILKWIKRPEQKINQVVYMIWRKPFMAVSQETFIGSVFERVSGGHRLSRFHTKYPVIELSQFETDTTLLLFSSEPFPFLRFETELRSLSFPSAIVDGELFSWFGTRSLKFLEHSSAHQN